MTSSTLWAGMFDDHHGELAQILLDQAASVTPGSPSYHQTWTDTDRQLRNHIRPIQGVGFDVTLNKTIRRHPQQDQLTQTAPKMPDHHIRPGSGAARPAEPRVFGQGPDMR